MEMRQLFEIGDTVKVANHYYLRGSITTVADVIDTELGYLYVLSGWSRIIVYENQLEKYEEADKYLAWFEGLNGEILYVSKDSYSNQFRCDSVDMWDAEADEDFHLTDKDIKRLDNTDISLNFNNIKED